MIPNPDAIANICHRLRVATHTASVYVRELGSEDMTPDVAQEIRADLSGYFQTVLAGLDALCPVHAVHLEPEAHVVEMSVWPRPTMPPLYADKPETWR